MRGCVRACACVCVFMCVRAYLAYERLYTHMLVDISVNIDPVSNWAVKETSDVKENLTTTLAVTTLCFCVSTETPDGVTVPKTTDLFNEISKYQHVVTTINTDYSVKRTPPSDGTN